MNGELVLRGVQKHLVLAGVVDDRDTRSVIRVVQRNDVSGARADDSLGDLPSVEHVAVLAWRSVLAIPQSAQNVRVVDVALLESNQDFVVDFRQELHAAPGATARYDDARPVAGVVLRKPGVQDLDPPEVIRIRIIGDHPDDQADAWGGQSVAFRAEQ